MRELNDREIDEVAAGFGFLGAAFGAAVGLASYTVNALTSDSEFHPARALLATASGAVAGFAGPVAVVAARAGRPIASAGATALGGTVAVGGAAGSGVIDGMRRHGRYRELDGPFMIEQ